MRVQRPGLPTTVPVLRGLWGLGFLTAWQLQGHQTLTWHLRAPRSKQSRGHPQGRQTQHLRDSNANGFTAMHFTYTATAFLPTQLRLLTAVLEFRLSIPDLETSSPSLVVNTHPQASLPGGTHPPSACPCAVVQPEAPRPMRSPSTSPSPAANTAPGTRRARHLLTEGVNSSTAE